MGVGMGTPKSIIVIGGGVIGLASAYYLAKRGCSVTVLEQRGANEPNCSTGNAGMVVPSHFIPLAAPGIVGQGLRWMLDSESPFSFRSRLSLEQWLWLWRFWRSCTPARVERAKPLLSYLSLESRRLFAHLADQEGLSFGLQRRGLVMLCQERKTLKHESAISAQGKALGVRAETLNADEVAKLDPGIDMDIAGGVYFADDCHLNPGVFRRELIRSVEAMGGVVEWDVKDVRVIRQGDAICCVEGAGREYHADEYVIAGGVATTCLGRSLGLKLPMQPGKGYSMTLQDVPQVPELCSLLIEARVAVTPMAGGVRFGGTMEIGGEEHVINLRKVSGIIKSIPRYFPQYDESMFATDDIWTGLRPCTPDGLPFVGRSKTFKNLSVAAGHSMLGLSLAPVTGSLVAQILHDEKMPSGVDIGLLSPDRYG